MESAYSNNYLLVAHTLRQLSEACSLIMHWNKATTSADDYLTSPEGIEKMAASCMLIESIGEGVKKIDKKLPEFLVKNAPEIPWRNIAGLRDHIAHGYFNLDADIIFDVVKNEIPALKETLEKLILIADSQQ